MARGIERREIFRDDKDRKAFLDRLAIILEETQTQCYAWALIPNHFHLLLRTGPTPLSKVMRRLMTGYAITFNKRHKRAGHLFQNRYKSIICEEDPYLLELIRYIHLNSLRAKLVRDLKELDKYPWTGHSAILGHRKNPLIPKQPNKPDRPDRPDRPKKCLAEKTIEDVLLHFGETVTVARRRYRDFVEKGIAQGRRLEFQGGGLVRPACHVRLERIWSGEKYRAANENRAIKDRVCKARAGRSAGGNKAGLLGRAKEEREKGDARILGSGHFVEATLHQSEKSLERKYRTKKPIDDLIKVTAEAVGLSPELICSGSRKPGISDARAMVAHMAIEEMGHSATDVARHLGIKQTSVLQSVKKGKILCCRVGMQA